MKRALLALGLAMAFVSVPLTFAKTNNHGTRRQWTPRPVRPSLTFRHNVTKHGRWHGALRGHGKNSPSPDDARKDQGFEE
jgi:hypothetical protein